MIYIIATLLRKAFDQWEELAGVSDPAEVWRQLMLLPDDYSDASLVEPLTRSLMERIDFEHGGPEYDARYPDGIPTSLVIEHAELGALDSGLVMYPIGHARSASPALESLLAHKFRLLASAGVEDAGALAQRLERLDELSPAEVAELYALPIRGLT
jgi:2-methylcitrate dehydratase